MSSLPENLKWYNFCLEVLLVLLKTWPYYYSLFSISIYIYTYSNVKLEWNLNGLQITRLWRLNFLIIVMIKQHFCKLEILPTHTSRYKIITLLAWNCQCLIFSRISLWFISKILVRTSITGVNWENVYNTHIKSKTMFLEGVEAYTKKRISVGREIGSGLWF